MFLPVTFYSEPFAVSRHSAEIGKLGRKALIVTGRSSAEKCGALRDVRNVLRDNKIEYVHFDEVEENPSVETVMKARELGIREKADMVIGIGGGSPLDAAKAASFLLNYPELDESALYNNCGENGHLPLVLVPTTCGTGSEVTQYSVLTLKEKHTKKSIAPHCFAQLALIDGRYLENAPLPIIRNTALDALGHLVESFLNTRSDVFSRMFVNSGLELWKNNRRILENGGADGEGLQALMNASAMAGMAIARTSTGIPHALSYTLTVHQNMPHGLAVGYFTPGFIQCAPEEERKELLSRMGFSGTEELADWFIRLCTPHGVTDDLLESAVMSVLNNPSKLKTAPFAVGRDELRRIAFFIKDHESRL